MFLFLSLACHRAEIYDDGINKDAVVLCHQAIVINIDEPKSDQELLVEMMSMIRTRHRCSTYEPEYALDFNNECYGRMYIGTDYYIHQEWIC